MMMRAEFSGNSVTLRFTIERLDMSIVRALREEVRAHLTGRPNPVLVDMANVTYMDSSGMGTLKLLMDDIQAYGGQMILANINQPQMMLLKLSKLDSYFKFQETQTPE
ncbi:MAG: STAS domain-containing protein [Spirochaetia bacterium]|nr:STAS domain-containing protein [Spirochaetia bacterium]